MADQSIIFQNVSFKYGHATEPLIRNLTIHFARGWTGIVGANGAGKSTILKLATGELNPQYGRVIIPGFAIYCQQHTDNIPSQLNNLIQTINSDAMKIRKLLGIEDDWVERWHTLSHGERKRAQIAIAMWQKPNVLAVDEPTNYLDLPSIECLEKAMFDCPCGLFLVSHDRRFLDSLVYKHWNVVEEKNVKGKYILNIQ